MSDGHLAEVQAELEIEKRTRDEVMALIIISSASISNWFRKMIW